MSVFYFLLFHSIKIKMLNEELKERIFAIVKLLDLNWSMSAHTDGHSHTRKTQHLLITASRNIQAKVLGQT